MLFFFNYTCKATITCGVWEKDSFCSYQYAQGMKSRQLTRRETEIIFLLLLQWWQIETHKSYWIENLSEANNDEWRSHGGVSPEDMSLFWPNPKEMWASFNSCSLLFLISIVLEDNKQENREAVYFMFINKWDFGKIWGERSTNFCSDAASEFSSGRVYLAFLLTSVIISILI